MDIIKIGIIGIIGAILAVALKDEKTSGFAVSVAVGVVLLFTVLPMLYEMYENIADIGRDIYVKEEYITVMLKAVGIGYGAMFSSQVCRDFGQNSIADKIELGGKVLILLNAMTVVNELIDEVLGFIV